MPKSLPDGATLQQQIQEAALQSATTSISGSQDDQALDASLEKHALATVMVAEAAYDEVLELHVEKPATTGVEQGAAQPAASTLSSKDRLIHKETGLENKPDQLHLDIQIAIDQKYSSDSDIYTV